MLAIKLSSSYGEIKFFLYLAIKNSRAILMALLQRHHQPLPLSNLVKADVAKREEEVGKEELVDLLGINVVTNVYKAKIKYDKHCDKMLNRRAQSRITNYDVQVNGLYYTKSYRRDGSD
ncbi:hypothetical protein Tco_0853056 [Tanacetum coccineum]